jgi:hypothetical protein
MSTTLLKSLLQLKNNIFFTYLREKHILKEECIQYALKQSLNREDLTLKLENYFLRRKNAGLVQGFAVSTITVFGLMLFTIYGCHQFHSVNLKKTLYLEIGIPLIVLLIIFHFGFLGYQANKWYQRAKSSFSDYDEIKRHIKKRKDIKNLADTLVKLLFEGVTLPDDFNKILAWFMYDKRLNDALEKKRDEELLTAVRETIQKKLNDIQPSQNDTSKSKLQILFLLNLLVMTDPENQYPIQVPVYDYSGQNQTQSISYTLKAIDITPKIMRIHNPPIQKRVYSYVMTPQDIDNQTKDAPVYIIHKGTGLSTSYGTDTQWWANTCFYTEVGGMLNYDPIDEFIEEYSSKNTPPNIYQTGISLGGAVTITAAQKHTRHKNLKSFAFNPPPRFYSRREESHENLNIIINKDDPLQRFHGWFPSNAKIWEVTNKNMDSTLGSLKHIAKHILIPLGHKKTAVVPKENKNSQTATSKDQVLQRNNIASPSIEQKTKEPSTEKTLLLSLQDDTSHDMAITLKEDILNNPKITTTRSKESPPRNDSQNTVTTSEKYKTVQGVILSYMIRPLFFCFIEKKIRFAMIWASIAVILTLHGSNSIAHLAARMNMHLTTEMNQINWLILSCWLTVAIFNFLTFMTTIKKCVGANHTKEDSHTSSKWSTDKKINVFFMLSSITCFTAIHILGKYESQYIHLIHKTALLSAPLLIYAILHISSTVYKRINYADIIQSSQENKLPDYVPPQPVTI